MVRQRVQLVRGAAAIVRIGRFVNGLLLVAIAAGLLGTRLSPGFCRNMLVRADPAVEVIAALTGVRLFLLVGVAMTIATDRMVFVRARVFATGSLMRDDLAGAV